MPIEKRSISLKIGQVQTAAGQTRMSFSLEAKEGAESYVQVHVSDPSSRGAGNVMFLGELQLQDLELVVAEVRKVVKGMQDANQIGKLTGPVF